MEFSKKILEYKVSPESFYRVYFSLMNGILKLTDKEIEVAAKLYYYKSVINSNIDTVANDLLFSTTSRKRMRDELNMGQMLFNNYLKALKDKNVVVEVNGYKSVNPKLEVDISKDGVELLFRLKFEDNVSKKK